MHFSTNIVLVKPVLWPKTLSPYMVLGIVLGVVMPLVSAMIYPTYMHRMPSPWVEWTRLLELPFVICEILVIHWALRNGMNSIAIWRSLPNDIKIASVLLFVGVFVSTILISANPLTSIAISLATCIHVLFALAVFHIVGQSSLDDVSALIYGLGAGLLSLAALTAFRFGFPPLASQVPGGVIEWSSALPGFINVRHFGSWTGAVAAAFVTKLLFAGPKQRLSWPHFFYFVSATMTVWSGTRAAIMALLVTAALLVAIRREIPSFRAVSIVAALTGAALTTAWLLLPYDDPSFLLYRAGAGLEANEITSGRTLLWTATFSKWLESPLIGWGSGSVFWEVYAGWPHTQPHNAILQFLISWGIVGATGGLWLLGRATVAASKSAIRQPSFQPLLAILFALLIMSLVEGMLHYPRFIMLIMLLFAVILSPNRAKQEQST